MSAKFFNTPEPKKFKIETRFYDKKKEEANMKAKRDAGDMEAYNEYRREKMREEWKSDKYDSKKQKAWIKLLILVVLAGVLLGLILI
ncbi:MAG: hypothetical protein PHU62_09235 [Bacteroidales bacterium]|jgi:hypothetical protein|nr:hypothetical protein [Bacteroidales bacterium]MDD2204205.1 hypothetical protein [Bacteroidales bacterium]MDD3153002.1 hypothetical protein [Bacteroidales bacterium]MDD3913622.1 hypothetical protein [Bacteroidales bacterium]MDD4634733.1 hypothetical protein [Bacteroidales bacterium]